MRKQPQKLQSINSKEFDEYCDAVVALDDFFFFPHFKNTFLFNNITETD